MGCGVEKHRGVARGVIVEVAHSAKPRRYIRAVQPEIPDVRAVGEWERRGCTQELEGVWCSVRVCTCGACVYICAACASALWVLCARVRGICGVRFT